MIRKVFKVCKNCGRDFIGHYKHWTEESRILYCSPDCKSDALAKARESIKKVQALKIAKKLEKNGQLRFTQINKQD